MINLCEVSLGLKEVQMGAHVLKHNKVPLLPKNSEYQCLRTAAPKLAFAPARRYNCDVKY